MLHTCYKARNYSLWEWYHSGLGGITIHSKTEPILIGNGSLVVQQYINEILDTQMRRCAHEVVQEFLFMQDNARAHASNDVQNFLRDHNSYSGLARI